MVLCAVCGALGSWTVGPCPEHDGRSHGLCEAHNRAVIEQAGLFPGCPVRNVVA